MTSKQKAERIEQILNRPEFKAIMVDEFKAIIRREIPGVTPYMLDHVGELFRDARLRVTPNVESEKNENG